MSDLPQILRNNASWLKERGFPKASEACTAGADEIERLEKERFKYETALMLIGEGIPQAASIAKAAIAKLEGEADAQREPGHSWLAP